MGRAPPPGIPLEVRREDRGEREKRLLKAQTSGLAGLREEGRGLPVTVCPGLGLGLDPECRIPVTGERSFWPPGSMWASSTHTHGVRLPAEKLRLGRLMVSQAALLCSAVTKPSCPGLQRPPCYLPVHLRARPGQDAGSVSLRPCPLLGRGCAGPSACFPLPSGLSGQSLATVGTQAAPVRGDFGFSTLSCHRHPQAASAAAW